MKLLIIISRLMILKVLFLFIKTLVPRLNTIPFLMDDYYIYLVSSSFNLLINENDKSINNGNYIKWIHFIID